MFPLSNAGATMQPLIQVPPWGRDRQLAARDGPGGTGWSGVEQELEGHRYPLQESRRVGRPSGDSQSFS